MEVTIDATASFFLFINLYNKPPITPAKVVFNKQTRIVPTGEMDIKTVTVFGDNKIIAPLTKPKKPPTRGPYIIAPMVITTKARLRLTAVGRIILNSCKIISIAVNRAVPTIIFVLNSLFFFIRLYYGLFFFKIKQENVAFYFFLNKYSCKMIS